MIELKKGDVRVGIAEAAAVLAPGTIATIGLGSCVGILLYDTHKKIAALIHIMLPDSKLFRNIPNAYKFADLAVPLMLEELKGQGCYKRNIIAKIAGGSSMFKFSEKNINSEVGLRNVNSVKEILEKEGIKLLAEDTGGNKGRTMIVDAETGQVQIKVVGGIIKTI